MCVVVVVVCAFDDVMMQKTLAATGNCQHVPDSLTSVAEKEVSKRGVEGCRKDRVGPDQAKNKETDAGQYGGGQPDSRKSDRRYNNVVHFCKSSQLFRRRPN